jgi:hypothetical protein
MPPLLFSSVPFYIRTHPNTHRLDIVGYTAFGISNKPTTATSSSKERSSPIPLYPAPPGHSTWWRPHPSASLALHCVRVLSDCEGPAAIAGDAGKGDVTGVVGRPRSGDILTIAGTLDFALSYNTLVLRCALLPSSPSPQCNNQLLNYSHCYRSAYTKNLSHRHDLESEDVQEFVKQAGRCCERYLHVRCSTVWCPQLSLEMYRRSPRTGLILIGKASSCPFKVVILLSLTAFFVHSMCCLIKLLRVRPSSDARQGVWRPQPTQSHRKYRHRR